VSPLATSTFLEVLFASMIVIPVMLLWGAAVVDVVRRGGSGLRIAAVLVLILIVPILGPLLYFAFRGPLVGAEDAYMAEADLRREAAARSPDGIGIHPGAGAPR
jgi:hypothetical protein